MIHPDQLRQSTKYGGVAPLICADPLRCRVCLAEQSAEEALDGVGVAVLLQESI